VAIAAAVVVPVRLAFALDHPVVGVNGLRLVQLLFLVDAILQCRSHLRRDVRSSQAEPVVRGAGWIILDAIAAIPVLWFSTSAIATLPLVCKVFGVARSMRLWRVSLVQWSDSLKLAFSAFWVLLSAHWLACIWSTITPTYEADGPTRYLQSAYWVIETLTTIGYGETTPVTNTQSIFALGLMLCGVAVYGYVIGSVASMLAKRDPAKTQYFEQLDQLNAFIRYRRLPLETRRRIQDYFAHVWQERHGFDESQFLGTLPSGLRREVEMHLKQRILQQIPVFSSLPPEFVEAVALSLKPDIYVPGEYICRAGEKGDRMYLLIRGCLEVVKAYGHLIGTLRDGDFFGEIALLKRQPRSASVRAVEYSDVYALDRAAFEVLLARYPQVAEQVREVSERRSGG
jgi:voltage-gated potassium channel